MHACHEPLTEVIKLWDFFFAFGFHLNPLVLVAQIILVRDIFVKNEEYSLDNMKKAYIFYRDLAQVLKLLQNLPPLNAKALISVTIRILPQIPEKLFNLMIKHMNDNQVCDEIVNGKINLQLL